MFNKQLYGHYKGLPTPGRTCYASWDISLFYEDEMQGSIKHPMEGCPNFADSPFFVAIELFNRPLYLFTISKEDFIF
jgi:hypothetical protein